MSSIIKRKLDLTTKEKTPSINYTPFSKIVEDIKTVTMEKDTSQNILVKQISEKFLQDRYFDGESVQVGQLCY